MRLVTLNLPRQQLHPHQQSVEANVDKTYASLDVVTLKPVSELQGKNQFTRESGRVKLSIKASSAVPHRRDTTLFVIFVRLQPDN